MERKGKRRIAITEDYIEWFLTNVPEKLQELVGGGTFKFREHFRLVLGAADRADPMRVWPLLDDEGNFPVRSEGKPTELYAIKKKCTNGANAGNQILSITPALDSLLSFIFVGVLNDDNVARDLEVGLYTHTNDLVSMHRDSIAAHRPIIYPNVLAAYGNISVNQLIINEEFKIGLGSYAIAVNKACNFYALCKLTGDAPTLAYSEPVGATWTDLTQAGDHIF